MMFSGNRLTGVAGNTALHVQQVSSSASSAFLTLTLAGKRPNLTDVIQPLLIAGDSLGCK